MSEITISNVGPVSHLTLPVPEGGGVVVIRGRNGIGKTKALEALESATTKRGQVEVRDGEERAEVEAFGVRMTVGRSTRRKGELECRTLEGRMSLGELIDPGLQDPLAADSRRIKALVQLCGARPSLDLFRNLLGSSEELERLTGKDLLGDCPDLVVMAERIKRVLEQEARKLEGQAEKFRATHTSLSEQASRLEVRTSLSYQQALERLREAAVLKSQVVERRSSYERAAAERDLMEHRMRAAEQEVDQAPTVVEIEMDLKQSRRDYDDLEARMVLARTELDGREVLRLSRMIDVAAAEIRNGQVSLEATIKLKRTLQEWRASLSVPLPAAVGQRDVELAAEQARAAEQEVRDAEERERHDKLVLDSIQYGEQSAKLERRGAAVRDAAAGCEQILSGVVESLGSGLRVERGRLVLDTDRGVEPYGELSVGERTPIALKIGMRALGSGGLIVLPQEIFEGLDPQNRATIAELARQTNTVVITASQGDQDEIFAEVMVE